MKLKIFSASPEKGAGYFGRGSFSSRFPVFSASTSLSVRLILPGSGHSPTGQGTHDILSSSDD
jgi:hypothetical protein